MFADIVGYSAQMERDEERSSDDTDRSIRLFRALIADYGGQIVQVYGDGILALFDSAEEALRFSLQVQSEFRDQAVWQDGQPIQLRIGVNLGEVMIREGSVRGHCVNVAARVQTLAEPGAVYVTAAVRAAVGENPALKLEPLGPHTLKNISEPIEVYAVRQVQEEGPKRLERRPVRLNVEPLVSDRPIIAVLNPSNMTGDPAYGHVCEGIAADLSENLSRFRSLIVLARHSTVFFSLRTQPVRDIGARLGAGYVLGGSVRSVGERIRIAVELIDARTESVVWSDHFDATTRDFFEVQDEITSAVASRLAVQIDDTERRSTASHPRDLRAYGLVLRGQHLMLQVRKEENHHARRLFEQAIEIEPGYGRAYSGMSRTHNLDWRYSWSPDPDASLDQAVAWARQAIARDRLDARAFAELGYALLYKREIDESLAEYRRALALNPNDADIIAEYADALVYAGEPARSVELFERAMRLNPYYPDWYLWYLADAFDALGESQKVITAIQRMQDPSEGARLLAVAYAHLGMMDEARAQAAEVLRLHPGFTISSWSTRPPYRDRAVFERYVEGLRRAGLPE
jgi:class 3 adenylate cyclase/tetratricopeptide (TPR) repeat protein